VIDMRDDGNIADILSYLVGQLTLSPDCFSSLVPESHLYTSATISSVKTDSL
jgi:hypothetical protein